MQLKAPLRLAWSEHGSWAILFTSFGMGTIVAWPPRLAAVSTLFGLCAVTAAKVLYVPARQRRVSVWLAAGLAAAGAAAFVPLLFSPRAAAWAKSVATHPHRPGLNSKAPAGFSSAHTSATGCVSIPIAFAIRLSIGDLLSGRPTDDAAPPQYSC